MKSLGAKLGILTFLFSIALINPAHAGIVISNGELKSWNPNPEDPDAPIIYFHKGSFSNVDSYALLQLDPWWQNAELAQDLAALLDNYLWENPEYQEILAPNPKVATPEFKFAIDLVPPETVANFSVFYADGRPDFDYIGPVSNTPLWGFDEDGYWLDPVDEPGLNINGVEFTFYYASLAPLPVPEPSTAIAMGLLSVLGFAGNRRRRRQS